ncbi:Organic cation transporter protein [Penaeus vannamei]|uniref:Organic cation transporter protein n=1 Tax=Penaeus vannamei TaxID=6689 RepID=A0A423U1T1_PENVA|nr:Organic cation transporter protein [Penaeus vannamei]
MTGSLWVFILVSITGSFSPYYQLFLLCRFLMAFTGNIVYQTSYIIARQRAVVGILFSVPFALGVMALPVVAFHVRQWHLLHLAMSVPVIVLIVNTILLPESPRWLVLTGRWSEAEKELQRAARWNGRKPFDSSWLLATLKEMQTEEKIPKEEQHEPDAPPSSSSSFSSRVKGALRSSLVFMRTPMLRRISLVMYFDWLVCTMVYYGISLNSANFSADPFLYMFLAGLMELPSYTLTIPFVVKFGRKAPLVAFFVLCALGTLVLMVLPGGRDTWWFLAVVMASKFCITSAYQVIYLYCSELYPTCLRTRGLGITSMVGRTGAIISPFITDMLVGRSPPGLLLGARGPLNLVAGRVPLAIPSTIFGSLSLVAALLTCLLPETNNRPLPDTIADVEAFSVSHTSNRGQIPRPSAASTGEGEDEEPCISPTSATSSV